MSQWSVWALAAVTPDQPRVPNVPNVPKEGTASRFGTFGTNGTQNDRSVSATMEPPPGLSFTRWKTVAGFSTRGVTSSGLGWRVEDVFGVDGVEPETGYGAIGLVAMIRRGALLP